MCADIHASMNLSLCIYTHTNPVCVNTLEIYTHTHNCIHVYLHTHTNTHTFTCI